MEKNIRVTFAGELEKFPKETQEVIRKAIDRTRENTGLELCLAINYGARREILLAMQKYAQQVNTGLRENDLREEEMKEYLFVPEDVDLLIRTSGEERISNFLLWQIAYAELIFTKKAWPEFNEADLDACLQEYDQRDRRFGGVK
jgi:undecaprenyl diphosphate synthase